MMMFMVVVGLAFLSGVATTKIWNYMRRPWKEPGDHSWLLNQYPWQVVIFKPKRFWRCYQYVGKIMMNESSVVYNRYDNHSLGGELFLVKYLLENCFAYPDPKGVVEYFTDKGYYCKVYRHESAKGLRIPNVETSKPT